jgi:hypothetical protein
MFQEIAKTSPPSAASWEAAFRYLPPGSPEARASAAAAEEPPPGDLSGWVLRRSASDQIYDLLKTTGPRDFGSSLAAQHKKELHWTLVQRKRSQVHKLHASNAQISRTIRDVKDSIYDVQKAGRPRSLGADYRSASLGRLVRNTSNFLGVLNPMTSLMREINQSNQALGELGDYAEGSRYTAAEARQLGSYFYDWSRESLAEGAELVRSSLNTLKSTLRKDHRPADAPPHPGDPQKEGPGARDRLSHSGPTALESLEQETARLQDSVSLGGMDTFS